MKRYTYKATDKKTRKAVSGVLQAESEREAGRMLVEQGYIPDKVEEEDTGGILAKLKNKVSSKDRIIFTRQFATLIGAGLPMSRSLKTAAEQSASTAMRTVIEDVSTSVEAGKSLSDALAAHPDVFGDVYLALVAAGETSGTLDVALARLATQDEKDANMISKIRGAMVYPIIIFVVIIVVLGFMMIEVVPEVRKLYEDMDKVLPTITQVLVNISDFFANQWWIVLLIFAAIVYGINAYRKTPSGKKTFALFKLNVPLFNTLFQRLYMNRFARTMEMLLGTGVSMLESMKISARATSNYYMEEQLNAASEKVKSGKPLSESIADLDYMLPLVPQMISIGEQSGKIDEMIGKAAEVYENELDEKIANISTMIEPVLMVIMAGLIGVVIAGTLLPIYSLVSAIG
ncbi:type II secretion system F family protein [Candidatus Saccharibacteria bacterium]|nr:type II secretion system F family protein [Candidatus Saccharibacteria bacterium]